jgi:hypothetical protein
VNLEEAQTELEVAYQLFLVRNNLNPDIDMKIAFIEGYADGVEAANDIWSRRVEKMIKGICAV